MLTGAAAGWAERCGVDPTVVRAALGVLGLAGGLGVAVYALAVLTSDGSGGHSDRADDGARGPDHAGQRLVRRELAIATATAALLLVARSVGLWPGDEIMVAAVAAAVGLVVVWTPGSRRHGDGWSLLRTRPTLQRVARAVIGLALVVAGVVSLADRTGGLEDVGSSAAAIAVVVGGLAVFGAPALGRLLRTLDEERANRIREDEMARVSAHLHDSVLQSLVLIQRSDEPREMVSLARRQERELRAWLYDDVDPGDPTTVAAAVTSMTNSIESDHHVRIETVVVGDQPLDAAATTLLGALREAVTNAARHAGVDRIDVFVEADVAELTGFVRDTGVGFDPSRTVNGHRGIADSIVGRVRRAGGTAMIDSQAGVGTEVEVRVPRARA